MIYLDYNTTTPIDERVAQEMEPYIHEKFGNPSSSHPIGKEAKSALEKARKQVANLLGAESKEITFTGGGTESNNTVLKGIAERYQDKGNHIIISQIEHPSVNNVCEFLEDRGIEITKVGVDQNGKVDPKELKKALTQDTILVSIMHANNEVGTIQPLSAISQIAHQNDVLVHTDAAQSLGKIPTRVDELGVDFLPVAGHKLYAPKGIGALYIRDGIELEPLIHGASQESGIRAGTENVIFSVGLGKACEIARTDPIGSKMEELTDYFYDNLKQNLGEKIVLNGHEKDRLPNTLNVSFRDIPGDEILDNLDQVAASTGSACHSDQKEPSSVLKAMGIDRDIALGAVRFSLGRYTTKEELNNVIEQLKNMPNL